MSNLPTTGYHITYLNRLPAIMESGLRRNLPSHLRTGFDQSGVYFIVDPSLSKWAAEDRNLDPKKDWVVIKATGLKPELIFEDEDFGDTPEESIARGGTFAYAADVPPEMLEVYATAEGSAEFYHDEFESLLKPKKLLGRSVGVRPWQLLPHLPKPEPENEGPVSPLYFGPESPFDFYLRRILFHRKWDALSPAIRRVGAAVAIDIASANLRQPIFYSSGGTARVHQTATNTCSGLVGITEQLATWIIDNPEKASLPYEMTVNFYDIVERCLQTFPVRPILLNMPFYWAARAFRALLISFLQNSDARLQNSDAWLRQSVVDAMSSIVYGDLAFDELRSSETEYRETDEHYRLMNESFRLWWTEVENVLAFRIKDERRPFA